MKVLILVSCALAVASAGWAPVSAPAGYHGPQHVPVIHNGVPVDTPEVQHAKAAHLAALAEAAAHPHYQHHEQPQHYDNEGYGQQYNSGYNGGNYGHGYSQPQISYSAPVHHAQPIHSAPAHHVAPAYQTSHVVPSIGHDGRPLDTPEVEAAKAHHFQAVHQALSLTAPHTGVQQQHYRKRRSLYAAHYPQHIPVINHNGVPVEPIEVQHARAAHLATHAAASHGYATHQLHAPVYGVYNAYSHHVPAIGHDGRPLDTPEVEHAKAAHFAAHHEAAARHGYAYGGHYGVVDTPAVQHAKALHFAAHAAAAAHHY